MQRKNELSLLNIIFCILVIFIHVSSAPVTFLLKESWQYGVFFVPWRLSAFVVQGFIFLSGLKMFLKEDTAGYRKYYKTRVTKIVLPYILTVILFYAYFWMRNYYEFSIKDLAGYIVKGDLVSHFYFVIAIVQFYVLKPVWTVMVKKISPKIAITISVILMFLFKYAFSSFAYNDRLFTTYLAYWVLGCYAGKCYGKVITNIRKYKKAYIPQFAIVALLEASISYTQFVYGGMKFLEELHFLYCISAILFAFSIATLMSDKLMEKNALKKIDNASYYIYLIHPLFIFITDEFLAKYGIYDIGTGFLIRSIITYTFSIFISVAYLEAKKKFARNELCQSLKRQG